MRTVKLALPESGAFSSEPIKKRRLPGEPSNQEEFIWASGWRLSRSIPIGSFLDKLARALSVRHQHRKDVSENNLSSFAAMRVARWHGGAALGFGNSSNKGSQRH